MDKMKFDVIIGNPPYNDANESAVKDLHETKTQGTATFYKYFIEKSHDLLKSDGVLAFILPPGAHKYFYNFGFNIDKVLFIDGRVWPKTIVARSWFASKLKTSKPTLPQLDPGIFSKICDWSQMRVRGAGVQGISTYNFTISTFTQTEEKVYKTSDIQALPKKEQSKANIKWNLTETDLNVKNLKTLLKFFHKYLHFFGYQWHSWNKLLKYTWLEGLTHEITNEDIIKYYKLTKDEIKTINEV